jgi:uncharacterized Zn finger protein
VVAESSSKLSSLLGEAALLTLAGPRSFARGTAYHRDGRVELADVGGERASAVVRGSLPYDVVLSVADNELAWSCSCPVGEDGDFCKHCVAVALSVAAAGGTPSKRARRTAKTQQPKVDLEAYVRSLGSDELAELVMTQVKEDWRLRERLTARVAAVKGTGIDEMAWSRRIDAVFAPYDDFVPYREAAGWATEVNDVIGALEELVDSGHAGAVIALAERAHRKADAAVQYIDDSDGWLSDISARLGSLHHRACVMSSPDPVELAGRLSDLELTSELDAFHRAAADYADVLGTDGIAEYRRRVEPKWRKLGPDSDRWSGDRFRVREAMIGIALATGDPDELIRVKQQDLRTPDDYREVAESLRAGGRVDDAIDWAHRGLATFADRPWQNGPLRELLAEMLRGQGDAIGAVELFWQAFDAHPSLETYRRLLTEADVVEARTPSRDRAISALRNRVAQRRADDQERHSLVTTTPASALIQILLHEGDVEDAWAAALEYGCEQRLWLTLARAREAGHPLDAIPVYEREALAQIDTKKNGGYRAAVDYLARIRKLAAAARQPARFDDFLAEIRVKHKPKRNLMALLDKRGWCA